MWCLHLSKADRTVNCFYKLHLKVPTPFCSITNFWDLWPISMQWCQRASPCYPQEQDQGFEQCFMSSTHEPISSPISYIVMPLVRNSELLDSHLHPGPSSCLLPVILVSDTYLPIPAMCHSSLPAAWTYQIPGLNLPKGHEWNTLEDALDILFALYRSTVPGAHGWLWIGKDWCKTNPSLPPL